MALFPDPSSQPLFPIILTALAGHTGLPLDVPYERFTPRQKRVLLHGCGEDWIEVYPTGKHKKGDRPLFKFQYKGLYPALEEAARLTPAFRAKLDHLVGEVECSACGGSRLRDDASAVRLLRPHRRQICGLPLGETLCLFNDWQLDDRERRSPASWFAKSATACSFWSTWAWNISRSAAPLPRFPAAKRSAFAWPAR